MYEAVGFIIAIIGVFGICAAIACVDKAPSKGGKIAITSFLIILLGVVLMLNPSLETWRLFLKNAVAAVPTWVLVIIGVWIYLNAGWRLAEYKLRVAKRWQTMHPILLHILWPLNAQDNNLCTNPPQKSWKISEGQYKFSTAVLLAAASVISLLAILIFWILWFATMGRFRPIHSEVWKTYRNAIRNPSCHIRNMIQ